MGIKRDLVNAVSSAQSLAPASRTAAVDGTGVDLRGFDSALVLISAGTLAGTATPTVTFEVQESDDDVVYTAVADADLDGTEPVVVAANDNGLFEIGYQGVKRFIRVAITAVSGTSPSLPSEAVVIRGNPHQTPA